MATASPLSSGSPNAPDYAYDAAVESSLVVARQAQHITDPGLPPIGFSNGVPGYLNACFRNSLVSLLVNLTPFAGWIVADTQGQLDASPSAHLLENVIRECFATNLVGKQARADRAIQRLYNYLNLWKPINPSNVTIRYPLNTQQDMVEALDYLLGDVSRELVSASNVVAANSFAAIYETVMVAQINCKSCGRGTRRSSENQDNSREPVLRTRLHSGTTSFEQLIAEAFAEDPTEAHCPRCKGRQPRVGKWRILKLPEVLLIDVNQVGQHPKHRTKLIKLGLQVPPIPEALNLSSYLTDEALKSGITAEYHLSGVINHAGSNPNAGHFVSHVRHNSGNWYLLNDATVSDSSVSKLQAYKPSYKANQMIPRLLAYVKVRREEGDQMISSQVARPEIGPRPFLQPQIIYDDLMGVNELKRLCKAHGLLPGNAKSGDSLRKVINNANSAKSTFATRLKDWLIPVILSTGEIVDFSTTKAQLAAQLRNFMAIQPARPPVWPTNPGTSERSGSENGKPQSGPTDATSHALDVAKRRIVELEKALTDLESTLRIDLRVAGLGSQASSGPDSPRYVNTDQVRALIARLPPTTSPRGTKRVAEGTPEEEPEAKKREQLIRAERSCALLDANEHLSRDVGAQAIPSPRASRGIGRNFVGTQTSPRSGRYNRNGSHHSSRVGASRDSDEENRRPPQGSPNSLGLVTIVHGRCHRCPQFPNEIHHMCAQVCGLQPHEEARVSRTSSLFSSESFASDEAYRGIPSDGEDTRDFLDDSDIGAAVNTEADRGIPSDGEDTHDFLDDSNIGAAINTEADRGIPSDGEDTHDFLDDSNIGAAVSTGAGRARTRSPRTQIKTESTSNG